MPKAGITAKLPALQIEFAEQGEKLPGAISSGCWASDCNSWCRGLMRKADQEFKPANSII
jgi:hypothetical protein